MRLFLVVSLCLSFTYYAICETPDTGIVNKLVQTKIDISSHLVKTEYVITVEKKEGHEAEHYLFQIEPEKSGDLSFIGAMSKTSDEDNELEVKPIGTGGKEGQLYSIRLPNKLRVSQTAQLTVTAVYGHMLEPYPAEITQQEKQFVRYAGNLVLYSPYTTVSQETLVVLASANVVSYTQTKPVRKLEAKLTYGPFNDKPPLTHEDLNVHYENNRPFLTVTDMTRSIEISHWGNVAVEETYDVYHSGAKLKGAFSRFHYQRNQDSLSSVRSFKMALPAAAKDVYYRDEIGNISTSHMREMIDSVELEVRPRFPLFGGWKTHFIIGYNVPSYEYLFVRDNQFVVKMRFVDHIYDDQLVDQMTLKIALPEGVTDVGFEPGLSGVRIGRSELLKTYLDTYGRTVLVAHRNNLVEQHIREFKVSYKFNRYMMLREPLFIIAAFFLLFVVVIIYVRLDFSITKDEAREYQMRVASLTDQVRHLHTRREALYQAYKDAVDRYKNSHDLTRLQTDRKRHHGDHKSLNGQLAGLAEQLRGPGITAVDVADKVMELQKLDAQYQDLIKESVRLAEQLVAKKLSKQAYVDAEDKVAARKEALAAKMDATIAAL